MYYNVLLMIIKEEDVKMSVDYSAMLVVGCKVKIDRIKLPKKEVKTYKCEECGSDEVTEYKTTVFCSVCGSNRISVVTRFERNSDFVDEVSYDKLHEVFDYVISADDTGFSSDTYFLCNVIHEVDDSGGDLVVRLTQNDLNFERTIKVFKGDLICDKIKDMPLAIQQSSVGVYLVLLIN